MLNGGGVQELGTHDDLLALKGLYSTCVLLSRVGVECRTGLLNGRMLNPNCYRLRAHLKYDQSLEILPCTDVLTMNYFTSLKPRDWER